MRFRAAAVIFTLAIGVSRVQSSTTQVTETALLVSEQFPIPLSNPFRAIEVRSMSNGHLLYLYRGPTGSAAVEQDQHGSVVKTTVIPGNLPSHHIAVARPGAFAVLQSSHVDGQILFFDANGILLPSVALPREAFGGEICYIGDRLFVSHNSLLFDPLAPNSGAISVPRSSSVFLALPLAPAGAVILDRATGMISVIGDEDGPSSVQIQATELQATIGTNRQMNLGPNAILHAFFSAGVNEKGEIFLGLSPVSVRTGPLILQVDAHSGQVKGRYRLALPLLPESPHTAGDPEGHMHPTWLSIAGKSLFVISLQQGMVASYLVN